MKLISQWLLLGLTACWPGVARSQLQLLPSREPQQVFAGGARDIAVVWQNTGRQPASAEIRTRVFQTTSATMVQLGESAWKTLQVLPGQTVLESAQIDFPDVKAETKFLVQWLLDTNRVIGVTQVRVYPTNLLGQLQMLAKNRSLGVFDPQSQLKPLLKNSKVDFVDLGESELEHFPGKLAIIGPFASKAQVPEGLAKRIKVLAQKGAAVVWILPPDTSKELHPSFYLVPECSGVVVVAQAALIADLAADPKSQLNLLYFCNLALHPRFLTLPDLSS
ncbi:MAG TPA: hypothetical protein VMA35_07875 [Candidatus Sulfopaludibacter sp.]|nr:hypothetical protein [Candidatus Sulfopaludibacter sp.]